jgi:hypothetical protein
VRKAAVARAKGTAIAATHSSTAPVINYIRRGKLGMGERAVPFNATVMEHACSGTINSVVLSAVWKWYFDDPEFEDALLQSVDALLASGVRVYFVLDAPAFPFNVPKALILNSMWGRDLFGNTKNVEGVAFVESTMPQNGELNTHMLACAIGFHLEPEPFSFTAEGNAWTHPVVGQAKPPSPDVYTLADILNGAIGPLFAGAEPDQFMRPAILEWGMWANYVAWHMVRAYDLRWAIGTKWNILDEVLRHTAYMPPSAQDGSSGNSQIDLLAAVRRTNDYYDALGTAFDFLKIDFIREGVLNNAGAPVGDFRPSRAFELAGVTYGGMDLRHMLRGNSEFRKLDLPYIIGAGIPIGLILQEVDSSQGDIMRDYLSITQGRQGNGVIPPFIVDAANINAGGTVSGAPVMLDQTLDTVFPPTTISASVFAERALFKMGDLKLSMLVKGRELDGDLMTFLRNNQEAREMLCSECECGFVNQ